MNSSADHVVALEHELLSPSTRGDVVRLDELLHREFVEVGASGRRWNRADMMEALVADPDPGGHEVDDVLASVISEDVVLVTYATRRATSSIHRASLWVRHGGGWAVRYHQGTPVRHDHPLTEGVARADRRRGRSSRCSSPPCARRDRRYRRCVRCQRLAGIRALPCRLRTDER